MARHILLIQNPGSGSAETDRVAALIGEGDAELSRCAIDNLGQAPREGIDRIVAAGGDGSLAPVAELAAELGVPLGVIPAGTANDFARAMELPEDIEEACVIARDGLETRPVDLAAIGGRPFLNAASAGLSPQAAKEAKTFKDRLGSLAYSLGAARAAALASPLDCTVRAGSATIHTGAAWQVTVASTGAFGGGAEVDSNDDDGALDVVVIEAGRRLRLLRHGYGLRTGGVEEQPGVVAARAAGIEVEVPAGTDFNVDGELVSDGDLRRAGGGGRAINFSVRARAVEVVVG